MVEFLNLRQGAMSVLEYSLKLTKLSKYVPSFVSDLTNECRMSWTNNVIRVCYMTIRTFLVSCFMVNKWNREGLRERVEIPRGKHLLIVVLQNEGFISKTSLGSRRGFLIKFLLSSLSIGMIGCLTLILKRKEVLVHQQ